MTPKNRDERTKNLVIIVLILFSFFIGLLLGTIIGTNAVINDLVDFIESSDVDISINLNETYLVDYMMESAKEQQKLLETKP